MAARSAAATASRDWIVRHAPDDRFERIEAYFGGRGYGLHRHDTYAIGCTLAGVQSFHYRRGLRHSLPGGVLVLHPTRPTTARPAPRPASTTAWRMCSRR